MTTRALVLSGGSVKGAYQVGVLRRWMGKWGWDYDIMCGVSVGALNVAGLSQVHKGMPTQAIEFLENFWLTRVTGTESIYKRWWPFGRLHSLWEKSVYDSSPLISLVRENFDIRKAQSCGRRVAVGAVCLDTGDHAFGHENDPNFIDWVLASSSYPVFMKPVEINGRLWSDGGLVNVTPLKQAILMGADEIDVIMCSDPWQKSVWGAERKVAVPDQIVRSLEIMSDQIMRNDIEIVGLKNELANIDNSYKHIKITLVMPSSKLTNDSLQFDPDEIRRMMDQGFDDAANFVVLD